MILIEHGCQLNILKHCKSLAEQLNVDALIGQLLNILEQELNISEACFYLAILGDEPAIELDPSNIRIITSEDPGISRAQTPDDVIILSEINYCYQTRSEQVIFLDSNMQRILFPVYTQTSLIGFLSLDTREPGFSDEHRDLIRKYAELFSVHFDMLKKYRSDALTGLMNRGAFDEMIFQTVRFSRRDPHNKNEPNKYPVLALLDIDLFKRINDNFGHVYGDEVLLLFAQIMRKSFRHFDWLFRYGGEEFAVILHNIPYEKVSCVLERFRKSVEEYRFPQVGQVTISIGAVEVRPGDAVPVIMEKADKALYYGKHNGRNQTHLYEDLVAEGILNEKAIRAGDIDIF